MKGDPAEQDAGGCDEAAALIPGMDAALTATGQDVRVHTMEEQIGGRWSKAAIGPVWSSCFCLRCRRTSVPNQRGDCGTLVPVWHSLEVGDFVLQVSGGSPSSRHRGNSSLFLWKDPRRRWDARRSVDEARHGETWG